MKIKKFQLDADLQRLEEYLNQDVFNPKYLFHGSSKLLKIIEQRQSQDLNNNPDNEDFAVFLTSSFIVATAYAFQDKINIEKGSCIPSDMHLIENQHLQQYQSYKPFYPMNILNHYLL